MPRRIRQKLRKELRRRAEARQQALRQRRLERKAASDRAAYELAHARRPDAVVPVAPGELFFQTLRGLMRLADVRRSEQLRVQRLCYAVVEHLPRSAVQRSLPWLLLLARQPWVRSPHTFRPSDYPDDDGNDALTRHLLAKWPVPAFLLRAPRVEGVDVARIPVEDEWAVSVLSHVGRGRPLATIAGTVALPAPLTRRMQHLFLETPRHWTPVEALRHAQVAGFGGPDALARALLRTRMRGVRGPDPGIGEPFWHDVVGWLCRHPDLAFDALSPDEADAILGWIEDRRREALHQGSVFTLDGRTGPSVRRDVAAWRSAQDASELPASGLSRRGFLAGRHRWTFTELTTAGALRQEGQEMGHCVGAYALLVRTHKAAIWSLRRDDGRVRATIEVAVGAGAIVQARGRFNQACTPEALDVVRQWAWWNRLELAF